MDRLEYSFPVDRCRRVLYLQPSLKARPAIDGFMKTTKIYTIMKKAALLLLAMTFGLSGTLIKAEAQILKGFGKKLEKKIEDRIERKADKQVDKALDKVDQKAAESVNGALDGAVPTKKNVPVFEEVAVDRGQSMTLIGGNCNDFSWFTKGAILEYEVMDGKGKVEASTRTEILDLRTEGSATIAEVQASMNTPETGEMSYQMNYVCEGDRIYMDMGSMMKALMENNPELAGNKEAQEALSNMEIDFENGFASFPKTMYPGLKLEDMNFSFKTSAGMGEMSFHTLVSDRQVLAKEMVTTKAGTFECLKIRSVSYTTMNVMVFNKAMPPTIDYLC